MTKTNTKTSMYHFKNIFYATITQSQQRQNIQLLLDTESGQENVSDRERKIPSFVQNVGSVVSSGCKI